MDSSDESSNSSSQSARKRASKDRNGKNKSAKAKANTSSKVSDDQIEQLCSITGNSDKTVARNLLEACNGNLEMAVNMALENAGASSSSGPNVTGDEEFVRAPIPQKQEVLVESYEGYSFGFKGKRRVVKSVFDSFRNFEEETRLQEARLRDLNGHEAVTSETAKKKTLEDLFRPPIDIMFKGNIQAARDFASSNKKWLMVNIQNVSEFACQVLNRDVWSHPAIKDMVREHFVFLQLYADSEEGKRYTMFYKVHQWPYIGILDPRTGECLCTWNNVDHVTCADLISEFLMSNTLEESDMSNEPEAKRQRQDKTLLDESEEAQLEAAIKASLTETKQATEVEEDSDFSEEEIESFESDSENHETANNLVKDEDSIQVSSNDWQNHLGPESDPKSTIVFRFPNGRKEQVIFPCSSSILCLLKYVGSQGFPCERFELVANFPKRQISQMEAKTTLKEAGLYPQDTVFIQSR